ncbi:Tat pathway signal protein [Paenibacillus macquariensis subsp. defensor]|nr:Tat pathway signal protein [Paenibacillus macquariensis subsp. defensor]
MVHLPNQTESKEMDTIEQWIRNSEMPRASMSHQIMNKIGDQTMSKTKSNFVRKTLVTVSAAAVLGVGVIGTGFVSPAMADALKQIPVIGSIFTGVSDEKLQTAIDQGIATSPNLSVTHDGVTLKVTDLLYDGTRLKFAVEREGVELSSVNAAYQGNNDGVKGYIESKEVRLLANGKEINYTGGSFGDVPYKENTYHVELSNGLSLPDQFELTIQAKVTQIEEPFEFKIPVKIENNMLVLKPNATETDGKFSYTVKQLEITPTTTRLILDSTGDVPKSPEQTGDYSATMVYYDIVDDQGNEINQDRVGFFNSKPETEYHVNELYQAFAATPKSITIKPYTFTVNTSDWKIVGASNGVAGDKTYLDDLELTIPVQP